MRRLLIPTMVLVALVQQIPNSATATTVVVNDNLKTYMQGTLNACAWAFTRAHKLGSTWIVNNVPAEATCTTDGVTKARSSPLDAIHQHSPNDHVKASAEAQCVGSCSTFTITNPVTVVSKPHSIAAGSYARGGVGANLAEATPNAALKGSLTVSIPNKMDLSSGTDPYESVFAMAITDQDWCEWNLQLAKLLEIVDPPSLPKKQRMKPAPDQADQKMHCNDLAISPKIEFVEPERTYLKLVVKLTVNGKLKVDVSGPAIITPPISEKDFTVKRVRCKPFIKKHQCFTANIKDDDLTFKIDMPEIYPKEIERPLVIDIINGKLARPPFE